MSECRTIVIPKVFSMSENAEETIKTLKEVYRALMDFKIRKVTFNYLECSNLGLSASTIMNSIVLAVEGYQKKSKEPLTEIIRQMPSDIKAQSMLLISGLPDYFKIQNFDKKQIKPFDIIKGKHDPDAKKADKTATELTKYFNRCLHTQQLTLNDEGKRLFSRILGEVITNCEIHGGENSTWYTQGYYQIEQDDSYGEMQLVFLNLGETIYEGLKNNSSFETKQKLEHMMKIQEEYLSKDWDEETIFTVLSLQEGISRLRDKNIQGYASRGSGTVSMIEMLNDIGRSETGLCPQMSIVSGNTQIKFTSRYRMSDKGFMNDAIFGTGKKQIIAFNDDNNIYIPANKDSVIKMEEYFPGTVISLKFYLDSRYINRKGKGNK